MSLSTSLFTAWPIASDANFRPGLVEHVNSVTLFVSGDTIVLFQALSVVSLPECHMCKKVYKNNANDVINLLNINNNSYDIDTSRSIIMEHENGHAQFLGVATQFNSIK